MEMKKSNRQVVIARFTEDLHWVNQLEVPHLIYNKGGPIQFESTQLAIHKTGREAHTFITHMMNRYDDLAEWTVFAQGNPFDHCCYFLDAYLDEPESGFQWLGHNTVRSDVHGDPHHPGLPIGLAYAMITSQQPPCFFYFVAGQQFIVHRDLIRRYSKHFYKRIYDIMDSQKFRDTWAWTMERLWEQIFTS